MDPARNPVAIAVALDARYRLIARLEAAATGDPLTEVPGFGVKWSEPVGFFSGKAAPPLRREVQVTFDYRMSLSSVYRELQRVWPRLLKRGAVRATRPLGRRTLTLIEHVCIRMPSASWAERHDAWNRFHKGWAIEERQAFIAEFRVAERSLSGAAYGLAYWYDPTSRLTSRELADRVRVGDAAAKRELKRRRAAGIQSIRRAGIEYVEYPPAEARNKGGTGRG